MDVGLDPELPRAVSTILQTWSQHPSASQITVDVQEVLLKKPRLDLAELLQLCSTALNKHGQALVAQDSSQGMGLLGLPSDLTLELLSACDLEDVCRAGRVARHWLKFTSSDQLWARLLSDGCALQLAPDRSENPEWEWEEDCSRCGEGGKLLCCDGCSTASHLKCAGLKRQPEGDWFCSYCMLVWYRNGEPLMGLHEYTADTGLDCPRAGVGRVPIPIRERTKPGIQKLAHTLGCLRRLANHLMIDLCDDDDGDEYMRTPWGGYHIRQTNGPGTGAYPIDHEGTKPVLHIFLEAELRGEALSHPPLGGSVMSDEQVAQCGRAFLRKRGLYTWLPGSDFERAKPQARQHLENIFEAEPMDDHGHEEEFFFPYEGIPLMEDSAEAAKLFVDAFGMGARFFTNKYTDGGLSLMKLLNGLRNSQWDDCLDTGILAIGEHWIGLLWFAGFHIS